MSVLQVNTINEVTSANGVTIDGLSLKDGNVVPAAGKGIDFSAASGSNAGSASALLDDYEEGTWTPFLKGGTTAGTYAYDTARTRGTYTKIGNQVMIRGCVRVSSVTSAGSGAALIGGLPFAPSTSDMGSYPRQPYNCLAQGTLTMPSNSVYVAIENTNTDLGLYCQTTTNPTAIDVTSADTVNQIFAFNVTYTTS